MKKGFLKMKILGGSLIVLVFFVGIFVFIKKGNIVPVGIYHLINLNNPPADLYTPLVLDDFMFSKNGFSKTYTVSPRYKDIHEIGVSFTEKGLDSKHKFEGVLGIEFLCGATVVLEKQVSSFQRSWFLNKEMTKDKKVSFETFNSLLCGNLEEIGIKVTVKKGDSLLEEFGTLYIAVSSAP